MAGRLVLVPTPLGNLEDITLRALQVLKEADIVAAEDTRHTGRLFAHFGIEAKFLSFHEHNEARQSVKLGALLEEGKTVALVSDAGTPGVSDPGFRAVRAAIEAGARVEVLPGPVALIPALLLSGLPVDRFIFEGFLPRKQGARRKAFEALGGETRTVLWYESPHRIGKRRSKMCAGNDIDVCCTPLGHPHHDLGELDGIDARSDALRADLTVLACRASKRAFGEEHRPRSCAGDQADGHDSSCPHTIGRWNCVVLVPPTLPIG